MKKLYTTTIQVAIIAEDENEAERTLNKNLDHHLNNNIVENGITIGYQFINDHKFNCLGNYDYATENYSDYP